ncbi:MAG: BTAD domain-containing putative transcriptional regulator [Actinomycetota bacterium]
MTDRPHDPSSARAGAGVRDGGGTDMDLRILGPLEAEEHGRPLPLGGAKQRALFAILLLHRNQAVSADRLIDLLWADEPPETAANTIQVYVSGLRKALEPGREPGAPSSVVVRRGPGYALELDPDALDADRFEHLVERARREDAERAAATLRDALMLWRGPALVDFAYEPFAQAEISRLEELRMIALEERVEAELSLGHHLLLAGELEALVAEHPLREGLRAQLMLALYRAGRQAEALNVYAETRQVLDEELGIDPSVRLQQLEQKILLQDASLEPAERRAPPAARRAVVRKTVSVLCCELDADGELDPEAREALTDRVHDLARSTLERHGAVVERTLGDQVLGVFGVPTVHEDDALRAARAAVEIRDAFPTLRSELRDEVDPMASFGIATGEVVTGDDATLPRGEVVTAANQLAHAAASAEILMDEGTHDRVGRVALTEPTTTDVGLRRSSGSFRLVGAVLPATEDARSLSAAMVGRRGELIQLSQAYERALKERGCHLFTVLGAAGVGKSRLLAEFLRMLGERAHVLTGRCPPYGEGVALLPARDIVKRAAGLDGHGAEEARAAIESLLEGQRDASHVAARVAELAGYAEPTGSLEEMFWGMRKLLESLARRRPVVVVLDDVHWAEPTLLDLVEHIAEWSRGVPLLLVCSARVEFLESRSSWGGGKVNTSSILLEPLSDRESLLLLRNLLDESSSSPDIDRRIVEAAEGNPLFVEEMARMLIDEGRLRREQGRWVPASDLSRVRIPPTIQALLEARLDRLGANERLLLQNAAVIGKTFTCELVTDLCEHELAADLRSLLMDLVRKELIRPDHADAREEAFRFRHILIRDVAYQQVSKQRRAELHETLANQLEGRADATPEVIAHHLERAFSYIRELRGVDARAGSLGARAAELLSSAARSAFAHGDLSRAIGMFERALDLLSERDRQRPHISLALSAALVDAGELKRAEASLRDVVAASDDELVLARAGMQLWEIRSASENLAGWKDAALRDATGAMDVFRAAGDELGMAKAMYLQASVLQYDYRFAHADAALEEALEHVRRAGDEQEEIKINLVYARSALFGPMHVDEALMRHHDFLERFRGNRKVEADCFRGMAMLEAMRGQFARARGLLTRARDVLSDLGLSLSAATSLAPGIVEMLAGDAVAAERAFRSSYEGLERAGERNIRANAAAYLARALYELGRHDEAYELTRISEELSPEDDFATMIEWASTRAKLLARRGLPEDADRLSNEVVGLASDTDELETRANALMDRAEVLRLIDRVNDAAPCLHDALQLYARKGDAASAERASRQITRGAPRVIDLREETATPRR